MEIRIRTVMGIEMGSANGNSNSNGNSGGNGVFLYYWDSDCGYIMVRSSVMGRFNYALQCYVVLIFLSFFLSVSIND